MKPKKLILLILLLPFIFTASALFAASGSLSGALPPGVSGTLPPGQLNHHPGKPGSEKAELFYLSRAFALDKIDSNLRRLWLNYRSSNQQIISDSANQDRKSSEKITIEIVFDGQASEIKKLTASLGGQVTGSSRDNSRLQALLPTEKLQNLADSPLIKYIRTPNRAVSFAGNYETEALDDINADNWQENGISGAGVKVGIIDVGFSGYKNLLGTELPSSVVAQSFIDNASYSDPDSGSVHGTACTEIIHDLAPGAQLYLATVWTEIDLDEAMRWMRDSCQVDIISTSLGWYNVSPGDGTGELADIVSDAFSAGILWVTAAGNDRLRHWGGVFSDANDNGMHDFAYDQEINFFGPGNGSAYLVEPGLTYTIYARWSDWSLVNQDFDIYVYRWNGSDWGAPIASGVNFQNGSPGQTPTEAVSFTTSGEATPYGFIIYDAFGIGGAVNFEIFLPNAPRLDKTVNSRSLPNLADSLQAVTVAAIDANTYYRPDYSAEGPTNGPGGTLNGGMNKPELAAYTNVTTASYGLQNFNGTSAATPHVAGTAALVLAENPGFSPSELKNYLFNSAIDLETSGYDLKTGYGRLFLDPQQAEPEICQPPASIVVPTSSSSGNYSISWSASATSSVTYILQEAADSGFTQNLRQLYPGSNLSYYISGKNNGRYYYRVKATRSGYTESSWKTGANSCLVTLPSLDGDTWLGLSQSWFSADNWESGQIPDSSTTVNVPNDPVGYYWPLLSTGSAQAASLTVSGTLTITYGTLTIGN